MSFPNLKSFADFFNGCFDELDEFCSVEVSTVPLLEESFSSFTRPSEGSLVLIFRSSECYIQELKYLKNISDYIIIKIKLHESDKTRKKKLTLQPNALKA
ncbi:hypothetical protein X975_15324, partial [Stegodyphus mimosarum]